MYMLDTNILIYAIRHPQHQVTERIILEAVNGQVCISAITYGELEIGILKSRNPGKNRLAVEAILAGIPVLSYDSCAAAFYAQIRAMLERAGQRVDDPDMMIGGHAASVNCILVTNNTQHFARMGIALEDWLQNR